jgi:hypothetical protein
MDYQQGLHFVVTRCMQVCSPLFGFGTCSETLAVDQNLIDFCVASVSSTSIYMQWRAICIRCIRCTNHRRNAQRCFGLNCQQTLKVGTEIISFIWFNVVLGFLVCYWNSHNCLCCIPTCIYCIYACTLLIQMGCTHTFFLSYLMIQFHGVSNMSVFFLRKFENKFLFTYLYHSIC